MLTHLHISNFALVNTLDLELESGLTAITGETGAGKSIMLDALGLALGDRSDADKVGPHNNKADIHASFDLNTLSFARDWLDKHDLTQGSECILRRVITKDGRSRAYINGSTVTLQQLRQFGEMLIDIHNQHEHQSLLKLSTHRRLLDEFAKQQDLSQQVRLSYAAWHQISEKLENIQAQSDDLNARYQLLHYQVSELDQLCIEEAELEALENEQRTLSNSENIQQQCQHVIDICNNDHDGLQQRLHSAVQMIGQLSADQDELKNVEGLLNNALINIQEALSDTERYVSGVEQNPSRLEEVEQRLSTIYDISRKHRVPPEELYQHHQKLAEELSGMSSGEDAVEALEKEKQARLEKYQTAASKLTRKREISAKTLAKSVNNQLKALAMEWAQLSVELTPLEEPSLYGQEKIEFLISTSPGQPAKPLNKVASGGELSRVSLAIQVVTAQTSTTPTLIFDEVDVGIGGTTGDVVGKMLRELGESTQIFCVTHLAQVASKAHHHFRVEKHISKQGATSSLCALDSDEKVLEIARMMGGDIESEQSLAHAREMVLSSCE